MSDPRMVTRAFVHKDGRLAATLTRTDLGMEFRYDEGYLADGGAAIAVSLPADDRSLVTPGRSVPPYFAGLLPEGRRLSALRRTLKASAEDELSLLLASGQDPVGDVTVGAHAEPPPIPEWEVTDSAWRDISFVDLAAGQGAVDPSSLAGVQDKVSGRMITVPLIHGGRAHLLKLTPPEFPRLVENEAFFLSHAARLPTDVVGWDVVHDRDDHPGLLITRFDRREGGGRLLRLPAEDATQLLGLYPADKYSVTTERVAAALAAVCASAPLALRALTVQVAWAWLTGNGDLHGKNISVVGRDTSDAGRRRPEFVVAPMYDIASTIPYGDHEMALTVDGSYTLTRRRLLRCVTDAGLTRAGAERALDATLTVATTMIEDVRGGGSPWSGKARSDLVRALRFRLRPLEA